MLLEPRNLLQSCSNCLARTRVNLPYFFSEEDIVALSSPFKHALIGKFSHGGPPLTEIKAAFEAIGLKATYSLGLLDPRHVLIRFTHEDDFHRIWLREIWYLKKFPMRVFKWSPDFRSSAE